MARLQFSKEPRRNEIDSTLDRADRQIAGEDWNCRGQEKAGRTPGGGGFGCLSERKLRLDVVTVRQTAGQCPNLERPITGRRDSF